MRKLLGILIIGIITIHHASAQIQNGSFEEVDNTTPLHWHFYNQDTVKNSIKVSNTVNYEGNNSILISKTNPKAMLNLSTGLEFNTSKSSKLNITAYTKTNSNNLVANFYLQTFDNDKKRIGGESQNINYDFNRMGEWQLVTFSLLLTPEIKHGILFINLSSSSELYIDRVKATWISEPPTENIKAFAKEVQDLIFTKSIISDSLDKKYIAESLPIYLTGMDDISANADNIVSFFLSQLRTKGDYHSMYINPKKFSDQKNVKVLQDSSTQDTRIPKGNMLENNIAYLSIPAISGHNNEKLQSYADTLNRIIINLQSQNPNGWIVDLTSNTGGNMYPMIAGLNALIDNGKILTFVNKNTERDMFMEDGKFSMITLSEKSQKIENKKIAILTSPMTSSSGEMTLLALLSMNNAKSFGYPTSGFTTANNVIPLSNGGAIALATAYTKDSKGNLIIGKIEPMVKVEAKNLNELISVASEWILE